MRAIIRLAAAFAAWLCAQTSSLAGTCALCRQALASGGRGGLIKGFYWSIILIAGVPLVIMVVVALIVWHRVQRGRVVHGHGVAGGVIDG